MRIVGKSKSVKTSRAFKIIPMLWGSAKKDGFRQELINMSWKHLYSEWASTSGYELANLPCIEGYYGPKHKPRHELWIPVIPK